MIDSNVQHFSSSMQHRQEALLNMHGKALTNLIHNIIREYGKYDRGNYVIDVMDLCLSDKKLVISYFESANDYEWACEHPSRTEAMFSEYSDFFQELADGECFEVYQEDQEEMRSYR